MMTWFDKVKAGVGWDEADQERVAALRGCLNSNGSDVVDVLGQQLAQLNGMQPLMSNARFVGRLHSVLHEWLMGVLGGVFEGERAEERQAFGTRLTEVDLTIEDIFLLEGLARKQLFELAQHHLAGNGDSLSDTMHSLDKALNLDLALIYSGYLRSRDAEMERTLLDRFLTITGFSRTLYENLAETQGQRQVDGR